jgi:hypothetical protein
MSEWTPSKFLAMCKTLCRYKCSSQSGPTCGPVISPPSSTHGADEETEAPELLAVWQFEFGTRSVDAQFYIWLTSCVVFYKLSGSCNSCSVGKEGAFNLDFLEFVISGSKTELTLLCYVWESSVKHSTAWCLKRRCVSLNKACEQLQVVRCL